MVVVLPMVARWLVSTAGRRTIVDGTRSVGTTRMLMQELESVSIQFVKSREE